MSSIQQLIGQFEKLHSNKDFEFGEKRRPAALEQIGALETLLGEKLPDDMRAFYQATNGWYSIDGRYMDINPIEELIESIEDSERKSMLMVGSSGTNDIYIYLYTSKATGQSPCFIVEDWFEEVQVSEESIQHLSQEFRDRLQRNVASLDEGKYLSPPLSFMQVLEHLLQHNATTG